MKIEIDDLLYNNIKNFCDFNSIDDIKGEIIEFIKTGFNIKKYGNTPFSTIQIKTEKEPLTTTKKVGRPKKVKDEIKMVEEVLTDEPKQTLIEQPQIVEKPKKKIRIIKN